MQLLWALLINKCLLTGGLACLLAQAAEADFVKTSTGFAGGGATVEDVHLMRETVGPEMGVKASGGVRTKEEAEAMVAAGATRTGRCRQGHGVGDRRGGEQCRNAPAQRDRNGRRCRDDRRGSVCRPRGCPACCRSRSGN